MLWPVLLLCGGNVCAQQSGELLPIAEINRLLVGSPHSVSPFWQMNFSSVRLLGSGSLPAPVDAAGKNPAGGSISVKSTPGEGSIFTVRIPAWNAGAHG